MHSSTLFTCRQLSRRHDDPRPPPLPPPHAAVNQLSHLGWPPTGHHIRPPTGTARTGRQSAPGGQLPSRTARRSAGGVPQQHLGHRVWRWGGHQAGQRGVPRAGLQGRNNVGPQRQVWRRRGWEFFRSHITVEAPWMGWMFYCGEVTESCHE